MRSTESQPPHDSKTLGPWVKAGLAATLVLLLAHAGLYAFLTDDAYISFRYARNLAEGHGLVFNPGFERVEGYTNFLWVLLLAGFRVIGVAPETSAPILSMAATVALWAVVVFFAVRSSGVRGIPILVAPFLLGVTRSVAVWSTGGLETRLFELLMFAGTLGLIVERRRLDGGGSPGRPVAALLLALGTLTRPDGLLVSLCAFSAVALQGWRRVRDRLPWLVRSLGFYGAVVGGHLLFRYGYYGQWLPNTYHAKVGGRTWWEMGARYLESFGLEYAAYLWLPFLAAAIVYHRRRGTLLIPAVFAAAVLPHALWVASIGGDHFEYRPLDLYFPFLFLLIGHGVAEIAGRHRGRLWAAAGLTILTLGLVELPLLSHLQYPSGYVPGFPGKVVETQEAAQRFLEPGRGLLHRLPGFRTAARGHRKLIRITTDGFVGIRQEEHRLFLDTAIHQARVLNGMIEDGTIPADTHVAVDCVGAIPYHTRLRVLDRLGLTDAHVARSEFVRPDIMAHGKYASRDYARERGVDLWAVDHVHLVWERDPRFYQRLIRLNRRARERHFAKLRDGRYLLVWLPQGIDAARRRFPALQFRSTHDVEAIGRVGLGVD